MEYICFEEMGTRPFLINERSSTMDMNSSGTPSPSTQLLESFHAQQQHLNPNYYYNPPQHFNIPAVSWSTIDPTLLLTDQEQQRPEELFNIGSGGISLKVSCDRRRDDDMGIEVSCCGLPSFPTTVQQLHHSRSSTDLHHRAAGANSSSVAAPEKMNLHVDTTMMDGGRSICRGTNVISSGSTASSIDPFSFCGGGGGGVNASSQSQWMQQMCSLPSDEYYSCGDALMMPKLVSDPFSDSPQQQQQPLATYYNSSTSVNCLHEADSCGSSDRERSTTSEEINWMNNSSGNKNSDIRTLPNFHRGSGGGNSVTGLMLSSSSSVVPVEFVPDEYSSSIAAAANDDVELAPVTITTLDHVRHHPLHQRSTCASSTTTAVARGAVAAAAPSGRVSWMSPGIGSAGKNNDIATLDPLLQLQQISNGLVPVLPQSVLGPFKPHQHRAHTLDTLPSVQRALPFSLSTSQQDYSSSRISPRYSSIHPIMPPLINPGVVDNCTSSNNGSFYKDFHSFSNRLPQQRGVVAGTSSSEPAGVIGVKEFNVGGGFESRREHSSDQLTLLSASRKPTATSIEPQSVAARQRRKKISERVRILEKLIPGGSKMDTASMLDEAIEYVKFLQLQVQLLESMGEPEALNSSTTAAPTTSTTATNTGNNNSSAFYPNNNNCKVDSSALIGGGFGSSSPLSRSASLMQQVTIAVAATTTTNSTSSPPLILSEVLQEQLFKQKLCLVSLRQYCPQQQARRSC